VTLLRNLMLLDGGCVDVALHGGVIASIAPAQGAADRLLIPGLINAHTHGHANLMKGVADRWLLESSLTHGPWMGGQRDAATIRFSTLLGAAEMLEAGCTACFDLFFEFPMPSAAGLLAAAEAYAEAGMRAVIAPMVADRTLFEAIPGLLDALPEDLRAQAARFRLPDAPTLLAALHEAFAIIPDLPPGITLALAPTIPHHCSDAFLAGCRAMADEFGLRLHTHAAESKLQALVARRLWGTGPVAHLDRHGLIGPHFTAAHAIWLDEGELDLLARRGASIAHMPASNLRLGNGVAPVAEWRARGIATGLGTDGCNSADSLDMFEAMRSAANLSRIRDVPRADWLHAAAVHAMATAGSAAVLGHAAPRIAVGAPADLVLLRLDHHAFVPLHDAATQIATGNAAGAVAEVFVAGRQVVRDGRCIATSGLDLRALSAAALADLTPRLAPSRALAMALEPHVADFAEYQSRAPLPFTRKLPTEHAA
jgi:cytosine/adenosine deaminase-related metal-dependent hydrolase